MGTLNVGRSVQHSQHAGNISLPLTSDLPQKYHITPLRRSNRVNIRLRNEDITGLEELAHSAGLPFHAFLSDLVHQYAQGKLVSSESGEKRTKKKD